MGIRRVHVVAMIMFLSVCFWTRDVASSRYAWAATEVGNQEHYIQVYYFHGKVRCYSCNMIEKLTVETIRESFPMEIENGRVKISVVNTSNSENEHFVKDYGLYSQSVILSEMNDGREVNWKNLIRVWELLRNEEVFKDYVRKEVKAFLEK